MLTRLTRRTLTSAALPLVLPARSLAHSPAASPPSLTSVDAVRAAIERLLLIEGAGDLETLTQRIHPSALRRFPGFVIAHWFRNRPPVTLELANDLTFVDLDRPMASPEVIPGMEAVYGYVEVGVTESAVDGTVTTVTRRYTQAGDEVLWIFDEPDADPAAALAELRAAGMQTDFQLVSFPADDIEIADVAPMTWEGFTRQDVGDFGYRESGFATYRPDDGSAGWLVYGWQRILASDLPRQAVWYAVTASSTPDAAPLEGATANLITAPDLVLATYTADDTFARVDAPSLLEPAGSRDDRAVYVVVREGDVWIHSVTVLATDPALNLPVNFATSLPIVAV